MTPDLKAQIAGYYAEAREALDGTGRHAGHTARQVGRCIYCSCGWRIGQGQLGKRNVNRVTHDTPAGYRQVHTSIPRPPGDRTPSGQ